MRIKHGPLLGARLTGRHSILAPRVRTNDVGFGDLFRLARIAGLVFRIFE